MDKRLLKSLTTAKERYQTKIAERNTLNIEDQKKLDSVNSMIDSLGATIPPTPDAGHEHEATKPEHSKESVPGFLKKHG